MGGGRGAQACAWPQTGSVESQAARVQSPSPGLDVSCPECSVQLILPLKGAAQVSSRKRNRQQCTEQLNTTRVEDEAGALWERK